MSIDRPLSRKIGVATREQIAGKTGFEILRAIRDGDLPAAPIADTLDFELTEVAPGRVVFRGRPAFRFYNPLGTVHGGYIGTLLDSCMGCAVHSTLEAGIGYTTVEFKVNFARPLTDKVEFVLAEGTVITSGSRIATAEGRLIDGDGRLYAHGTTTCLVFPLG